MADETKPKPPVVVEQLPSTEGGLSAIASASAPYIFTDWIGSHALINGVAYITLEALRHMEVGDVSVRDRVVVAHLRMPLGAATTLRTVLQTIELGAQPIPDKLKN